MVSRRARIIRFVTLSLVAVLIAIVAVWTGRTIAERNETARSTARFDPPVGAGQNIIAGCSGGFYARHGTTIVLTSSAHCGSPGDRLVDPEGRLVGVLGPRAQLLDCPAGRFCAPSDFLGMALPADRIPWGHLNVVDMGAGGYRTIEPGTPALACDDVAIGDPLEIDGREHYRRGVVLSKGPYSLDTIFPCLIVGDPLVITGDSGGAVLVRGLPAGIIARQLNGKLGFTPLAEGLENLGLTLCTTPNCDLSPERAVQPAPS